MLSDLIDAHQNAMAQFEKACDDLESVTDQYEVAQAKDRLLLKLHNVSLSVDTGREWLREYVDAEIDKASRQMAFINSVSPEFAEQYADFLKSAQADLYARIDEALIEEERRETEFGLTEAREQYDCMSKAENECLEAIYSYCCADHDEERARLQYILSNSSSINSLDDMRDVLLQSVITDRDMVNERLTP